MALDYDEKRDFRRIGADTRVTIRISDTADTLEARCLNLSAVGIMIRTDRSFPVGTMLDVNITPDYSVVKPLDASVEVVRVQKNGDGSYDIGGVIRTMRS